jgi:hypothetical protein
MPAGTKALKLVPKTPQPDYDWIVLLVDQTTLGLRLMSTDAQRRDIDFFLCKPEGKREPGR